jgi:sortase family protein
MRRSLPFLGLATAIIVAALGGALLERPSDASPPRRIDRNAPPPLELPSDPSIRVVLPTPAAAPAVLAEGVRVRLPRLRIDLALLPGDVVRDIDEERTPVSGAFLLPGSAVPGTTGNAYVYAHARTGLFLALWDVRLGDLVEIAQPSGAILRFAVTEIHPRVPPTDLEYIAPTNDERLTLQTSTGPTGDDPRFVVVAMPVSRSWIHEDN